MRLTYGARLEEAYKKMSPTEFNEIMTSMNIGSDSALRRNFFSELGNLEGLDILELGVGTGYNLPFYTAAKSVVGLDLSENMLNAARKSAELYGLENISDMTSEKPGNKKFDVVILTYVLTGTSNMSKTFAEALDYIKIGGRIAILDTYGFSTSICNNIFNIVMRSDKRGSGLRDSCYDVYYSQRDRFRIDNVARFNGFNRYDMETQKQYWLIGTRRNKTSQATLTEKS